MPPENIETLWFPLKPVDDFKTDTLIFTVPYGTASTGQPQFGQIEALSEISFPHSVHLISAILFPPKNKKCAAEATHRKTHNSDCCDTTFDRL